MAGSFASELFKLRKRPATWIIGGILVLSVGLLGYLFSYQIVLDQRAMEAQGSDLPGTSAEETILPTLLPGERAAKRPQWLLRRGRRSSASARGPRVRQRVRLGDAQDPAGPAPRESWARSSAAPSLSASSSASSLF